MNAQVVLVCGPAGAGKTTHARSLEALGYVRLSFDEIAWDHGHREHPVPAEVAESVHAEIARLLLAHVAAGENVVVDTSFWSRASRDRYRALLAEPGVVPVVHHVRADQAEVLVRLARRRGDGPHDVVVPVERALAYLAGFEPPTEAEGPLVEV